MIELEFSDKDMQVGRVLDSSWYVLRVIKMYLKQKNNKPVGDMNIVADLEVVGGSDANGDAEGVYVKSSYFPSLGHAKGLFAAMGVQIEKGVKVRLENFVNIDVDGFVKPGDEYNGVISNEAKAFAALGTHTNK